jgi:hypothetical protein
LAEMDGWEANKCLNWSRYFLCIQLSRRLVVT